LALSLFRALDLAAPPPVFARAPAAPAHTLWRADADCPACPAAEACEPCTACAACEICDPLIDASASELAVQWLGSGLRTALTLLSGLADELLVGGVLLLGTGLLTCCSCLGSCTRRVRSSPVAQTRLAGYRR
jgi:hypothetical protein